MPLDASRSHLAGFAWAGAVLLAALAFCPAMEQPGWAPREALLLAGTPLLLALGIASTRNRPATLFLVLMAVPLVAGLAGVFRAPEVERTGVARDLWVLAAPWIAAAAAALYGSRDRDPDDAIEAGAILALIAAGLIGLAQAWWGFSGIEQAGPPAVTFVNRNVAAHALVALLPLAVPAMLRTRSGWRRWSAAGAVGLGLMLLIATRTRGGWVGAGVGIVLGAVTWFGAKGAARPRLAAAPALLALALAMFALFVPVRDRAGRLPSVVARVESVVQRPDLSGTIRLALWRNTLALIADHPLFGVGAGRFAVIYPLYHHAAVETPGFGAERQAEHAHEDPLEAAAELGLPAAVAWIGALGLAIALALRGARRAGSELAVARLAAWAAVLGGVLAHALFSFPLHDPASGFLCWLVAGRAWSAIGRAAPARRARALALICALSLAPPAIWLAACELRGQVALREALTAFERNECPRALEAAWNVRRHAPWRRRDIGIAAMVVFECEPDPRASLAVLEPALALQPHQWNLLLATAARRLKAGAAGEAARAYGHAIEIDPGSGPAWAGLALARRAAGDLPAAAEACAAALRVAPDLEPVRSVCAGRPAIP